MIKKLLNNILGFFSYEFYKKNKIEVYLSKSLDLADLENRIKEIDKSRDFNRLYL